MYDEVESEYMRNKVKCWFIFVQYIVKRRNTGNRKASTEAWSTCANSKASRSDDVTAGSSMRRVSLHVSVTTARWPACKFSPRLVEVFWRLNNQLVRLHSQVNGESVWLHVFFLTVVICTVHSTCTPGWISSCISMIIVHVDLLNSSDLLAERPWQRSVKRLTTGSGSRLRMELLWSIAPCSWWWEIVEEIRYSYLMGFVGLCCFQTCPPEQIQLHVSVIQVVILHHMLSKASVRARPSVLWCYKKELGFSRYELN